MEEPSDHVLYSPGYGAGWSTWMGDGASARFAARYQPIVDFLNGGGEFKERPGVKTDWDKPWDEFFEPGRTVLKRFCEEFNEQFDGWPYLGGAEQLETLYHPGPVYIEEYDGSEDVITENVLTI